MSDDATDTPILPAHIELHLCIDGTLVSRAQDATMGTLSIHIVPDERLRQSIESDTSGINRLHVARATSVFCRAVCMRIADSTPDNAVISTTIDTTDETEESDEDLFEKDDIICFGDNRMPSSWTYAIYKGVDDDRLLFQGIHSIGRLFKGFVPLTSYVIKQVPVPFSGIDGLIYASTIFETHDETFYQETFSLIEDEDVLRDIVLDKECTITTAKIAISFFKTQKSLEYVKGKIGARGRDLAVACDKRIRELRNKKTLCIVDPEKK